MLRRSKAAPPWHAPGGGTPSTALRYSAARCSAGCGPCDAAAGSSCPRIARTPSRVSCAGPAGAPCCGCAAARSCVPTGIACSNTCDAPRPSCRPAASSNSGSKTFNDPFVPRQWAHTGTIPRAAPSTSGNVPGSTGRDFPSAHPSQSAARQKPLTGPGPPEPPRRSASLETSCHPAAGPLRSSAPWSARRPRSPCWEWATQ